MSTQAIGLLIAATLSFGTDGEIPDRVALDECNWCKGTPLEEPQPGYPNAEYQIDIGPFCPQEPPPDEGDWHCRDCGFAGVCVEGNKFYLEDDPCSEGNDPECWGSSESLATDVEALLAAIESEDGLAVEALVAGSPFIAFDSELSAIQIVDCAGRLSAHLPVSEILAGMLRD